MLDATPLRIGVIGVGGTGSVVVSHLLNMHLALVALGYGGIELVAFDPDVVAPANIVRQRYAPGDIGKNKAQTLIHRINMSYATHWTAVPQRFSAKFAKTKWDVLISCVDTRVSRAQLRTITMNVANFGDRVTEYFLDMGNDATTGQTILGTPYGPKTQPRLHELPCATDLHPELYDTTQPEDTAASCSAIEAIAKQDLFVNAQVALAGIQMLWRLFRDGSLSYHGVYFNLLTGAHSTLPVPRARKRAPSQRIAKRAA